jgi:spermidine/putrescine transport system permease protein
MKNRTILPNIYVIFIFLFMYLPIAIVITYSFNMSRLSVFWDGFTLDWYVQMLQDETMLNALKNSLILGVLSSLFAAVIGTLGAVGIAKKKILGSNTMEYFAILPIMVPEIILGMVFLAFFSLIGLSFGMLTLILAHTAFCVPYIYLLVKARLTGLDKSYVEAARDLGAGEIRAFLSITMPLMMPAIISGMLLAFAMSFDDVIISSFVTGVDSNTLPLLIFSQLKIGLTPKTNALCTVIFLATIIIVLASILIGRPKKKNRFPIGG